MKKIVLKKLIHRNLNHIALYFDFDSQLQQIAKNLGCTWSNTHKCWYINNTPANLKELYRIYKGVAYINGDEFFKKKEDKPAVARPPVARPPVARPPVARPPVARPPVAAPPVAAPPKMNLPALSDEDKKGKLLKFKYRMRQRRYSDNTIKTYIDALSLFFRFYNDKPVHKIKNDDLVRFNNEYILANKFSASYQGQIINAIKLFYSTMQEKELNTDKIERPRKERKLPNVLSKEEVKAILTSPLNIKHKAMLGLIYACGLRSGELLMLKPEHIDSKRKVLIIKQGKGKKDRIVPLSLKIIELLREYYKTCKPKEWLFEGQRPGENYSAKSLQMVLKKAVKDAKIRKPVSLHWLRHSYATHLLENGTDLRFIQEMLGHNSSRTTEIYTHVSTRHIQQIVSPFDYL